MATLVDPKARLRHLLLERPEYRSLYQVSPEFRYALDGIVDLLPLLLKTAAAAADDAAKYREDETLAAFNQDLNYDIDRIVGKRQHRVKALPKYV